MKLSSRAYDLFQAFALSGCPVCRLTVDSVHHYLDSLIYEYVTEPETHAALRAARGFCRTHAWHVQEEINASALGVAILYEGLVRTLLRELDGPGLRGGKRQVARAASALAAQQECPACTHQATVEDHLLRNLLEHLDQDEFAAAFGQSAGLCLPHLRHSLQLPGGAGPKTHLLTLQQTIWARLERDLAEFIRKYDYHAAGEAMGDEGTSARRAIEQMAGAKGLR